MRRCRWLAAATALVALNGCRSSAPALSESATETTAPSDAAASVALEQFEFGGDFTLTDQTGKPFSLAEHRGKIGLLFFGYTMCPDVCPMTLSKVSQALEALGPARDQVEVYFVSVDVERDTPAVLAKYIDGFGATVTGLTGSREEVDRVVEQYRATYEITPSTSVGGPLVSHSTYTYLLDRQGKLRLLFRHADTPSTLTAGLKAALAETTPTTTKAGAALTLARMRGSVSHMAAAAIGASRYAVSYVEAGARPTIWYASSAADGTRLESPVRVGTLEGAAAKADGELLLDINAPAAPGAPKRADALASDIVVQWSLAGRPSSTWRSADGGHSFAHTAASADTLVQWRVAPGTDGAAEPRAVPPGANNPLASQRLTRPSAAARLLAVGLDAHGALFGTWHEPARDRLTVHRYGFDWTGMSNRAEVFDIPVTLVAERSEAVSAAAGTPYRDGALVVWSRRSGSETTLEGRLVTLDLLCTPPRPGGALQSLGAPAASRAPGG